MFCGCGAMAARSGTKYTGGTTYSITNPTVFLYCCDDCLRVRRSKGERMIGCCEEQLPPQHCDCVASVSTLGIISLLMKLRFRRPRQYATTHCTLNFCLLEESDIEVMGSLPETQACFSLSLCVIKCLPGLETLGTSTTHLPMTVAELRQTVGQAWRAVCRRKIQVLVQRSMSHRVRAIQSRRGSHAILVTQRIAQ